LEPRTRPPTYACHLTVHATATHIRSYITDAMSASSSSHSSMEGMDSPGARRAIGLLFTIPDRFYDFCHLDQKTFFELADWIMANVTSQLSSEISIEESLFMFLDVVARGNSFTNVACDWEHDVQLTQRYVGTMLDVCGCGVVLTVCVSAVYS
jgi:hypothetical protein